MDLFAKPMGSSWIPSRRATSSFPTWSLKSWRSRRSSRTHRCFCCVCSWWLVSWCACLSKEAEVARLVHSVVQFLTLKVAPYLTLDDQEKANKIDFPPPTHATCAVAVVLHKLCVGWLDVLGADFTKEMQDSWGSAFSLSMEPWFVNNTSAVWE